METTDRRIPTHLYLGIALIVVFWFASWAHLGVLGEYAFFPLWLGYILTVDALVVMRRGSSLLTRHPRELVALFFLSALIWWVFEGLNNFVLNWHYITPGDYSVLQIIVESSICFSIVIPAVFETTHLVVTFSFIERFKTQRRFSVAPSFPWVLMYLGAFSFAAVVLVPLYAFPLTWVWVVLIVDPLNYLRGRASLLKQVEIGDWRLVIALSIAVTMCGFFWEMWNFYSMPKWFYTVPFVGFGKVFEMPILGYGGYTPFAWELYALYYFAWGILKRPAMAFEQK